LKGPPRLSAPFVSDGESRPELGVESVESAPAAADGRS
jgi:hypothetical protein